MQNQPPTNSRAMNPNDACPMGAILHRGESRGMSNRGKPRIPQADLDRARAMRAAGQTWKQITDELFVSHMGIYRALRRDENPFEDDNDFGCDSVAAAVSEAPDAEF